MKLYNALHYFSFLSYLFISPVNSESNFDYRKTPEKIFAGCLSTKHCYSPDQRDVSDKDTNCIESADCHHLVAIGGGQDGDTNTENEMVFELYAESKAWIGIGFSNDKKMGDDYVIACLRPNVSIIKETGTIVIEDDILPTVRNSWNAPVGKNNKHIEENNNIRVAETYVSTLAIYCKFYLKKKFVKIDPFKNKKHQFDLSKEYCLLVAWSDFFSYNLNPESVDPIGNHFMRKRNKENFKKGGQKPCKDFSTFDTVYQPTPTQKFYFQIHGICMITAWVFLIPVGNFIGCFFKDIYKKRTTCKIKTWLLLHCVFHVISLVPTIVGALIHFWGKTGWKNHNGRDLIHVVGGYSVIILHIISLVSGIYLKVKKRKLQESSAHKMHYPTFIHEVSSHAAHFLASLVIAWSSELQFSDLSCHFAYVVLGWMILYIFLCVTMAFHRFWGPILSDETENVDDPMSRMGALLTVTEGENNVEDHPKTMKLKTTALIVFAIISFFMAVALIAMLIWPPVGPCFSKESDAFFNKQALARYQKQTVANSESVFVDEDFVAELVSYKPFYPYPPPTTTTTPTSTTTPTTTTTTKPKEPEPEPPKT